MILLNAFDSSLPLVNPILKFFVILLIILITPLVLNRIKVPQLLGLIIAGAIIGPYGLHLMDRDSSIVLSGTAGLLYIMFLAGLEIDLADFKKNRKKSIIFGLYTFAIPMVICYLAGYYVLHFSVITSVLFASMLASHTLIAYPLISKLGVAKNKAVNIAIGGTMITDTLALLVLAVIVGMTTGEVNSLFWTRLTISIIVFGLIVMLVFPIIGRWFLKRFDDNISQYIFVLVMVFLGAVLAEIAGIEGIIGAFLTGLALNRLIPHTSPLMNRIEFVGNAIFIPFFLIGVGMLIDYRAFFKDFETIKVAGVMIVIAIVSKFLAAWITQKSFRMSADQRRLIFGLSSAQAAATLAAVLVGYNIILGETPDGEPIRLLNESVLNGSILMILVTCTMASFIAQKGAKNIALQETSESETDEQEEESERILIPISNLDTTDELVNLGVTIKSKNNKNGLYALTIVNNTDTSNVVADKRAKKILHQAAVIAAATDNHLNELLRYDLNITNGISSVIKENKITDLILGLHIKKGISDSFLGHLTEGILTKSNTTTLIYKPIQPFGTIKRHVVIIPPHAEDEIGFALWLIKVWNIARNSGAKMIFYATPSTQKYLSEILTKHPIDASFITFEDWEDFLILTRDLHNDDNVIIVLSRKDKPSFNNTMNKIPSYLNKYFRDFSYILIYPMQSGVTEGGEMGMIDPHSFVQPFERLDEFGRTISKLFKKK